jgi:hypothetical protein
MVRITISIILIITLGCKNIAPRIKDNLREIDIQKCFDSTVSLNLSKFGDSIDYIKLETSPSCLIGEIEKCIVDKQGIFVFSNM